MTLGFIGHKLSPMRLGELLEELEVVSLGREVDPLEEVYGVTENSKEVRKGFLFVAVKGEKADGHSYIEEAVERGAVAVLSERKVSEKDVVVKNTRKALGVSTSKFYGHPSRELKVVGVTGTNGKSSTVFLLKKAMDFLGVPAASMGTLGALWEGKSFPLPNTTPSPVLINKLMREMVDDGVKYLFMEVSSHAVKQDRIYGVSFYKGIFTRSGRDHLDYHKSLQDYKETKKEFFRRYAKECIVNLDDPWGVEIKKELGEKVVTVGIRNKKADYTLLNYVLSKDGSSGEISKHGKSILTFHTHLIGYVNLYNVLNVASFLLEEGFPPSDVAGAISFLEPVPGRLEKVIDGVYIDYAHTPDALRELIRSLRDVVKGRVIVVFGCGGDRDRGKRPQMGRIAEKMADVVLVTSDNPRTEDPMMIIDDIVSGMVERPLAEKEIKRSGRGTFTNPDRRWMIEFALRLKKEDDVVVVAGKGHEDYMELGSKKIRFSDRDVILEKAAKIYGRRLVQPRRAS